MVYQFKTKPRAHQLDCFKKSALKPVFALLMEAGTGKTKVVLDTAAYLFMLGKIDLLFVVAPNGVHRNWMDECEKHIPDHIDYVSAFWGPRAKDRAEFNKVIEWRHNGPLLRILAMNIEALSHKSGLDMAIKAFKGRKPFMTVDESHKIKTPGASRTKACVNLGLRAEFRRILTGTPLTKGYEDFYAQFKFLNPQIINAKTFAEFRSRYCKMGGYEFRSVVGYMNVDDLLKRISPFSFEANKKDCLDLPPQTFVRTEVELSDEQKRLYKQLKDDFILEVSKEDTFEVTVAMTRIMRLQAIISGFVANPETKESMAIPGPNPRLDKVVDLVEEAQRGKIVVWTRFRWDVRAVCDRLQAEGYSVFPYYGDMKETQRYESLQGFRAAPPGAVWVATRATGGTGLTVVEADTAINYSHDWKWEERDQAHSRNHRIGQTRPCTYYDLVAPGTADVKCLAKLAERDNIANSVKNLSEFRKLLTEL